VTGRNLSLVIRVLARMTDEERGIMDTVSATYDRGVLLLAPLGHPGLVLHRDDLFALGDEF
jgi:hypothetical protein